MDKEEAYARRAVRRPLTSAMQERARAAGALAASPSRACIGPRPTETLPTIRSRSERSRPSLTSSAPGHARATGGTFMTHRARSTTGPRARKHAAARGQPTSALSRSFCRDFLGACAHAGPLIIRRRTTHNREVRGSIHPELSRLCSGMRFLAVVARCRAAVTQGLGDLPAGSELPVHVGVLHDDASLRPGAASHALHRQS